MNGDSKFRGMNWTLGVIAVLVLYVLSIGPVVGWSYATGRDFTSLPPWVTTFYAPVGWAYAHNEPLRQLLDDHRFWWASFFMKQRAVGP